MPTSLLTFEKVADKNTLQNLKKTWQASLTMPNDDYDEAMMNLATHWAIQKAGQNIGYACVNHDNTLLQFFVLPKWQDRSIDVLKAFIAERKIEKARVTTNNPNYLSTAMHLQKSSEVYGYLFANMVDAPLGNCKDIFRTAEEKDLASLVDFSHQTLDAPKDWLNDYIGGWIKKDGFFVLENDTEILGTCEVRINDENPSIASLGMVVSAQHRKQGLGTYLLGAAKAIALERGLQAICGCPKDNIGSLKAIQKNGFRIAHTDLLLRF